jgi:glycosyltransferase involved in cell wall biosynthesis
LNNAEWTQLTSIAPFWPMSAVVRQCEQVRQPWTLGVPKQNSRIVLLDVRALQLPNMNGTKNHALALMRSFISALPDGYELAFFTTRDRPALTPDLASLASVTWRPSLIGDVEIFVQLATVMDALEPTNIDLLRAPWIQRVSVFLDDIQGIYPRHFIGSEDAFWVHQLAIEKLRSSHVVLTLGKTSQNEAVALWESLDEDEPQPRIEISSCLSGLPLTGARDPLEVADEFLVFGNHYPHKNLALVAAVAGVAKLATGITSTFTFVADVSQAHAAALDSLASLNGEVKSLIRFAGGLSSKGLSQRVTKARAIIIPSLHEGFSLPVIEAVERGAPVLLSRIPAHQELLTDGPWFFDPRDVSSLLDCLRAFEEDGETWPDVQRAAVAARYSEDTMPTIVSDIMQSLASVRELRRAVPPRAPERNTSTAKSSQTLTNPIDLRDQDVTYMSILRTTLSPGTHSGQSSRISALTLRHEHDALVAEFHSSRTWKLGRAVGAPLRWVQRIVRGGAR